MKPYLSLLFAAGVGSSCAFAAAQINGPAQPPPPSPQQIIDMHFDGHCLDVHGGEAVRFSLTVEHVETAKAVYGELQLRAGRVHSVNANGSLPMPDERTLAGGGLGAVDAQGSNQYNFVLKIPEGTQTGVYRGAGVLVTVDHPPTTAARRDAFRDDVDVTKKTREEVKAFCLNVMNGYPSETPVVTAFEPGSVIPAPTVKPQVTAALPLSKAPVYALPPSTTAPATTTVPPPSTGVSKQR